ncbi:MAG: Rieske (2Fe-2S) protein [Chloroflexi bacterium]|nr:MAG: Rieske (2Fe-2S) protein [Chloroflexota bacterium]
MEAEAESVSAAQPTHAAAAPVPARSIAVDTPVAKPVPKRNVITRLVGILGSPLDFMWIRKIVGFGGPVPVSPDRVPAAGADPIVIAEGRFFLLNLEPGITPNGETTPGGLLALWRKCPHLGCTVPWRPDFVFQGRKGWFRCPCHGSTYTKEGGIIVAGPAPRPLDVFPIEVQGDRSLVVQTGRAFEGSGSLQNPTRAVPYGPGNKTPGKK